MKLDELKKKLYKPEADFEERLEGPETFQPEQKRKQAISQEWQKIEKKKLSPQQKKKLLIIGISVVVIFLAGAGFFIWRGLTSFDADKVELEIKGAERVVSGEEIVYRVKYKNNTRLALENIKLVFHYPEDSIPSRQKDLDEIIDLPDLAVGQEEEIELPVRIIGLKGEERRAWAELSYQLAGLSSRYTNQAEFVSQVISVPLILDFDLPEKLVSGQSFSFSLRYLNQAEVAFDNLRVRIEYPAGFVFQSANRQALEEDRIWSLGKLMAGEQGKIFIQAIIQGEEGEVKSFKAQLGFFKDDQFVSYAETIDALQISSSPLSVSQTVNGSTDYIVQAGQRLTYQISYKNTTNVSIKNVVITSKLKGEVLDFTSLELGGGSFNGASQTITWKASNLPALEYLGPHQQGQVSFSVKVKDSLPINNYNDKNFKIVNTVKINSLEKPLSLGDIEISGESQLITKVASQMILQAQGYYYDDLISNSGPIPPKIGQTTTYTIKWRLVNTSNDLKRVKVEAFLPPHVKWNNGISPSGANLKYNSQTGQVIWSVGDLPAATGILLPVREVAFQVSITPSLAYLGNLVELIGQSKAIGQDNFVNLELTSIDKAIDTDLPDDPKIDRSKGIVVE
jgi:hypothetical protein